LATREFLCLELPNVDWFHELSRVANLVLAIFVIVDPFAVVPVFLSITEHADSRVRERTARKASLIAFAILAFFALFGLILFDFFGITLPAFQIAGGILLLRLGLAQLAADRTRVRPEEAEESLARDDVSVFPLATPLLAGPGAISTVVLLASKQESKLGVTSLVCAVAIALVASYFMLRFASVLYRVLGKTGLNLLTRIMGIILTAIAIQFMINGVLAVVRLLKA
jgi:multiple antibiotic resistance protein